MQVYTGMIYRGPRIVRDITGGLADALRERGITANDLVRTAAAAGA